MKMKFQLNSVSFRLHYSHFLVVKQQNVFNILQQLMLLQGWLSIVLSLADTKNDGGYNWFENSNFIYKISTV